MLFEWLSIPKIPNISQLPKEISKSVMNYVLRWLLRRYVDADSFGDSGIDLHRKSFNLSVIMLISVISPIDIMYRHSIHISLTRP